MKNWDILKRIIKGDLRPYLVNSEKELAKVEALRNSRKPHAALGELIDLEYPAPIGTKSETYYWLIKYETRAIEDSLKGLLEDIPIEEQLQQEITRHLLYGIHLKEESRVSRLRINEAPEAKQIDEDCYVLGFFETYIHQLLSNLADLYQLILPEKQSTHLSIKLHSNNLAQISKTNATINSLTDQIKRKKVSLFELRISPDKLDHFLNKLHQYFKKRGGIRVDYEKFRCHFIPADQSFEVLTWYRPIPELKYAFVHLINRGVIVAPTENLDRLIPLHFVDRSQNPIKENYLSQSLSRLSGKEKALQIEKDLDLLISH